MTTERDRILREAIAIYGTAPQCLMMIEEMSELIKALCKRSRGEKWDQSTLNAVLEEMADVQIMLDQMKIIFGDPSEIEGAKIVRLESRIREHYSAGGDG